MVGFITVFSELMMYFFHLSYVLALLCATGRYNRVTECSGKLSGCVMVRCIILLLEYGLFIISFKCP